MASEPIPSDLASKYGDRLAALSPAQRALLESKLKQKEAAARAEAPATPQGRKIPLRKQQNFCPLSVDQERLWFVQQLDHDSPIYNIYSASRFKAAIHVPTLARAVDDIVAKHEILRTSFPALDGRPVQQIAPELKPGMPWVDLRGLPLERRRAEADRVANEAVRRPFSLVKLPLFRMLMIQVAEEDFIWPATLHHIITDWIAFYNFIELIQSTYQAFLKGEPSPTPVPPIQYADFCVWQRERLLTQDLENQLNYWKELLKDVSDLVPLPIDRPRPPVQSAWGGRQRVRIAKAATDNLRALAKEETTTPFVLLLAIVKAMLLRYSGETKLIIGTPMSHRIEPETQSLLGFFLSQLIYCSDFSGNPSFREAVKREREASIAAYMHSEVPFSKLVEALRPERDLSRTPFFQIQLLLLNPQQATGGGVTDYAEDGGGSEGYWVDAKRTQSELAPILWETSKGLDGFFEYNKAIFDASTIDRMKEQFRVLLTAAVARPETPLWDLPILPEVQQHQLLVEWNDSREVPATSGSRYLHGLFERHAAARPERPALILDDETVSYGELDRRARRLAHHLLRLGVGPEVPVVSAVDRSAAAFVAFLGVLKAGGVYVPVEPSIPADRAQFILRDTGAAAVLWSRELGWDLGGAHKVMMGEEGSWPEPAAGLTPEALGLTPQHLAYVIYTSGSTGEPKGVGVPHGPAAIHCETSAHEYAAQPGDRFLQFSIFAFDAIIEQTFAALSGGATLVSRGDEIWDPSELGDRLAKLGVNVADLPTSYWGRWAQSLPKSAEKAATPLRLATPAGEAMTDGWVRHWQASAYGDVPLLNGYGPTEAVVTATSYAVANPYEAVGIAGMVPIGRPLPGRTAYVIDSAGNAVPGGVPGELCLGGELLARGYLNRPELTAASFVPDAFSGEAGARLYRTGDRVRLLADGVIEFLGRIDFQVKVRGFRIELGEIESALLADPTVHEAAVIARPDGGSHRLAAFVVAEPGQTPAAFALREALRERLPEYMVPASIAVVPELPYLPNGKVDRRALSALPDEVQADDAEYAAPTNAVEAALATIWSEVLRRDRVGIHDNFFSLGGDSILSIQMIARAQRAGLQLSPRALFQHQTIAELALVTESALAVAAEQGPVTGPVPLTPIESWWLGTDPIDPHHFNLTVLFETAVPLQPKFLAAAFAVLEGHHDALRLRFTRGADGGWSQENAAPGGAPPFAHVDLSRLGDEAASRAVEAGAAAAQGSLELAAGPVHRGLLFDLGPARPGRLFWTVHHLVIDGVSWRILLEDLATAYAALERTGTADLPPKTTSYKQWAERLAAHAAAPVVAGEATYWSALPWNRVEPLPVDDAAGDNTVASEETVSFSLEADETTALLTEVHEAYNTRINDVLLAGFALAVADWTRSPYVLFDLEGHGREAVFPEVDLSRTVGWFTTIYPVLLDLSRSADLESAIKSIKEHLRNVPGNGLGFGLLRHLAPAGAALGELPPAEVAFNYLGQLDQALPEAVPFTMARESFGSQTSPRARRAYLLDWNGGIFGGRLQMTCSFSAGVHRRDTVERLVEGFAKRLRALIEHCRNKDARGFTPSDFAGARLNQKDLDKLLGKLGKK